MTGDDKHLYSGHRACFPSSRGSAKPAEHRGSRQGKGDRRANARRAASAYPGGSPGAPLSMARSWPQPPGPGPAAASSRTCVHAPGTSQPARPALARVGPAAAASAPLRPAPPDGPRGFSERQVPSATANAKAKELGALRPASGEKNRSLGQPAEQPRGWRAARAQEGSIVATLDPRCSLKKARGRVARGKAKTEKGN